MIVGSTFCIVGTNMVGIYIFEGLIRQFGEVGQSLLFWYSLFLLFGIAGVAVGVGIVYATGIRWKEVPPLG